MIIILMQNANIKVQNFGIPLRGFNFELYNVILIFKF